MSRVLIVSKTRMGEGRVCIGGVDLDNNCSLRLLNDVGFHEKIDDCPYNVLDVWDIDYTFWPNRSLPHSKEDVRVRSRNFISHKKLNAQDLRQMLINALPIYEGDILNTFGRCLKSARVNSGVLYVSRDNVPDHSTCFYVIDKAIQRADYNNKIRFKYPTASWGYNIAYVGIEQNLHDTLPAGTLLRLSLAHWWSGDGSGEERCYLQISGYFL